MRGVALTQSGPDVRLGLSYDHAGGAYASGALIVGAGERGDGVKALGYVANIGFARRLSRPVGLSWDVGLTNTAISDYVYSADRRVTPQTPARVPPRDFRYRADYLEAYAGVTRGPLSAHLYLSPDYLDQGLRTAYVQVAGTIHPARRLRLSAHAGLLTPIGGGAGSGAAVVSRGRHDEQLDLRAAAAIELGRAEVQLAWTAVSPGMDYPPAYSQRRQALTASATVFF